jgi:hypothetical protein
MERYQALSKPIRFALLFLMLILVVGTILPGSTAFASQSKAPDQTGAAIDEFGTDVLTTQFNQLKKQYNRSEKEVRPLEAGLLKLLNNYKTLYNQGNKNWDEMRVLFYDYFSAYYAAKSHRLEGKLLIQNHNGFSSTGKVVNRPLAKYTVSQLRGTVLLLKDRIIECREILREGKQLMKQSKDKDK